MICKVMHGLFGLFVQRPVLIIYATVHIELALIGLYYPIDSDPIIDIASLQGSICKASQESISIAGPNGLLRNQLRDARYI